MLFAVMAEYSEAAKVKGQGLFYFLPSTASQMELANLTLTEEVTDSFGHDKPLWKSLAGVDKLRVIFGKLHFMQSDQTSSLINVVQLISPTSSHHLSLFPTHPNICQAWILEVLFKNIYFLFTLDDV